MAKQELLSAGNPSVTNTSFFNPRNFVLKLCLMLLLIDAFLILYYKVQLDYRGFAFTLSFVSILFLVGTGYKKYRNGGENIGVTLICTSLLILFSNLGAIFNYLMLHLIGNSVDQYLADIDALLFNFNWLAYIEWFSNFPVAVSILSYFYNSSLPQVVILILLLGFSGRHIRLWQFILCLVISASITIFIWTLLPSFGTLYLYQIPDLIESKIDLFVENSYGSELIRLAEASQVYISPMNIKGLIAFPSYHTIMALSVCYAAAPFPRPFRLLVYAINALVIVSVPLHGGHHLIDLVAAVVVYLIVVLAIHHYFQPIKREP